MRLPSTTAQERANWADEEVRLLAELSALHARGVDLSRFPGGAEFATAGAEAIGAG
jgi:hypothetical protein